MVLNKPVRRVRPLNSIKKKKERKTKPIIFVSFSQDHSLVLLRSRTDVTGKIYKKVYNTTRSQKLLRSSEISLFGIYLL